MNQKAKALIKMIFWIAVMIMIFWIPEFSVIVGIGIFLSWIWKKIRDKLWITFQIRKK